jgi:hypothetical protein
MTLEEAIKHCEDVAEENEKEFRLCPYSSQDCSGTQDCRWLENEESKGCLKCADEHRQLAEWLKELKAVHDEIDDADDEDEIFIGYLRKKMRGE